jgi:hypothetical protein
MNGLLFDCFAGLLFCSSTVLSKSFFEKPNQLSIAGAFHFFHIPALEYLYNGMEKCHFRELRKWKSDEGNRCFIVFVNPQKTKDVLG